MLLNTLVSQAARATENVHVIACKSTRALTYMDAPGVRMNTADSLHDTETVRSTHQQLRVPLYARACGVALSCTSVLWENTAIMISGRDVRYTSTSIYTPDNDGRVAAVHYSEYTFQLKRDE